MVNLTANINEAQNILNGILKNDPVQSKTNPNRTGILETGNPDTQKAEFSDAIKVIEDYISNVDNLQQSSDMSITDLLSNSNADITSVVSAVAKADLSFKVLVGVRNKLIEAYKQTMNMPL